MVGTERTRGNTARSWVSRVAALCCLLLAVQARGAEPAAGSSSSPPTGVTAVEDLVRAALADNPSIRAARAAVDGVKATSRVATSYADPSLSATWWPEKAADTLPETWEFMLEQGIPFPGTLGAVSGVRAAEEAAASLALERTIREVTLRVRESAVELDYLRTARRLAESNGELLGRLRAAGESAYAVGRTGLYDALRAQSQQSQALFDERLLAEMEATEAARLNSLLSRAGDAPVGPLDLRAGRPLAAELAEIAERAASARIEVRLAREEGNRSRAERRLAGYEARPELMLGVGYMQESSLADMAATNRWQFKLGMSLPLRLGKNRARREAAGAGEARAAAMEREAADEARAEVSEAWFRLRNAERLVSLYRDVLLPQATASIGLADTWYRAGQGSFADLVEAGTLRYSFELALARAGADREKYLARLEALAERPLTGERAAAAETRTADDAAWRAALEAIDTRRAALEAEASPIQGLLPADGPRLAALSPAAEDPAAAARVLESGIALVDLELLALLRSPAVRAAARSFRAALEQYGQVAALDDLARGYATATGSLMTGVGGAMGEGTASLFPFPGMLALKGEIVTADARAALEDLGRARRDALAEARRLYWSLVFARRAAGLLGEILSLAEQGAQAVRSRYESGQGALADLSRARVEVEKIRTELATVLEERGVIEAQLRSLLALPRDAALGAPGAGEAIPVPGSRDALADLALERRQELRRMRAMAERMELMIQMAEREVVPGFARELSLFEPQPLLQAGTMAMSPPFPVDAPAATGEGTPRRAFSGRTAGYLRETRERLAALREEIRAEEEMTVARVREAWFVLDRARRERHLWAVKLDELNRLAAETGDRAYRAGRASLPEVLEASRTAREGTLEAERRLMELGQAWAALEAAVGAPLPVAARQP